MFQARVLTYELFQPIVSVLLQYLINCVNHQLSVPLVATILCIFKGEAE